MATPELEILNIYQIDLHSKVSYVITDSDSKEMNGDLSGLSGFVIGVNNGTGDNVFRFYKSPSNVGTFMGKLKQIVSVPKEELVNGVLSEYLSKREEYASKVEVVGTNFIMEQLPLLSERASLEIRLREVDERIHLLDLIKSQDIVACVTPSIGDYVSELFKEK